MKEEGTLPNLYNTQEHQPNENQRVTSFYPESRGSIKAGDTKSHQDSSSIPEMPSPLNASTLKISHVILQKRFSCFL